MLLVSEVQVLLRLPESVGLRVEGHGYWPDSRPLFLYIVTPFVSGRTLDAPPGRAPLARHAPGELDFAPLPPEMRGVGDTMARECEGYFRAELLPRDMAETPVSLIVNYREPPETTLFHALFTSDPTNLP